MCKTDFCLYFFYNRTSGSNYKEKSDTKLNHEIVKIVSRRKILYHYPVTNESTNVFLDASAYDS